MKIADNRLPRLQAKCLKSRRKSFPKETSLASSLIRKSMSGRAYCEIGARGELGKATKHRVESKSPIIGFLVSKQNVRSLGESLSQRRQVWPVVPLERACLGGPTAKYVRGVSKGKPRNTGLRANR